jgi:hypothetical protein
MQVLRTALPHLGALRRALLGARDQLLLGTGTGPLAANHTATAHGSDLALLAAGRTFCPRAPATFKACGFDGLEQVVPRSAPATRGSTARTHPVPHTAHHAQQS